MRKRYTTYVTTDSASTYCCALCYPYRAHAQAYSGVSGSGTATLA